MNDRMPSLVPWVTRVDALCADGKVRTVEVRDHADTFYTMPAAVPRQCRGFLMFMGPAGGDWHALCFTGRRYRDDWPNSLDAAAWESFAPDSVRYARH